MVNNGQSPGVTRDGAFFQVVVCERVDTGTQPFAFFLIHGVQNMEDLITSDVQRAAIRLAGDIQIETYVEGVSRYHCAIFNILQQPSVALKQESRRSKQSNLILSGQTIYNMHNT